MEVEINGVLYREKYVSPQESSLVRTFMRLSQMTGERRYVRKRPEVNIVTEFERIQNKKSHLSASDRRWVEAQFHKHFEEVTEEMTAVNKLIEGLKMKDND